jgi:hypothetical protein
MHPTFSGLLYMKAATNRSSTPREVCFAFVGGGAHRALKSELRRRSDDCKETSAEGGADM